MAYTKATILQNNYTYANLIAYAQTIHDAILAQIATFATPIIAMATFQTDITAMAAALTAWSPIYPHGSHLQLLTLRNTRTTVLNDMRALAAYVNTIALGSAATVSLSGFTGTQLYTPVPVLNPPQNLRQLAQELGQARIIIAWKKPDNSGFGRVPAYRVIYSPTGGSDVVFIVTRCKAVIQSTVLGETGQVQVYALNPSGIGSPAGIATLAI